MIDTKQRAKYILEEYANCYSQVDLEELAKYLGEIKAEAYKECIEKVRNLAVGMHPCSDELRVFDSDLDNILKGLVGEDNAKEKE